MKLLNNYFIYHLLNFYQIASVKSFTPIFDHRFDLMITHHGSRAMHSVSSFNKAALSFLLFLMFSTVTL